MLLRSEEGHRPITSQLRGDGVEGVEKEKLSGAWRSKRS